MTSEQKAKELVEKFYVKFSSRSREFDKILNATKHHKSVSWYKSISCAIICCDEIIDILGGEGVWSFADAKVYEFWQSVKDEILKL